MNTTSTSQEIKAIGSKQGGMEDWKTRLPPPNLPCGDLLGNRDDYSNICAPLYSASIQGDWKAVQVILEKHPDRDLLGFAISEDYDTALHIAASARRNKSVEMIVQNLVHKMTVKQLELQNKNYNSALCLAAVNGNLEIAVIMLEKNPTLVNIRGNGGMMPLYMASLHGNHAIVNYLYDNYNKMTGKYWTDESRGLVLLRCTEADLFVFAVIDLKVGPTEKPSDAMQLLRVIWRNIMKLPKAKIDDILKGPEDVSIEEDGPHNPKDSSQILFAAAKMGNIEFVVELIRQNPHLMWRTNDNNQTIFHVAVSHRHEDIYNLVYEIGSMIHMITCLEDKKGNNMLHLVGDCAKLNGLHMRHELLWFMEVKHLMPPSYRQRKNNDGITPHELFIREHKDLFSENVKWKKDTANQCLVVAALIASIGFAAAITVPGGYFQDNGIPIFLHNPSFTVFAIADPISLIFSTTSILMFLCIFISPIAQDDFMKPLTEKMMNGLVSLFLSISTMLVGFSVSYFLLYHEKLTRMPIFIFLLVSLPLTLYARDLFYLVRNVVKPQYGANNLFMPKRFRLYYQNPRF